MVAVETKYAYSTDGVYTNSKISTKTVTTQEDKTAGSNWNDRATTTTITKINPDYQEGKGTVGGPNKDSYFEVIEDDLVLKYNVHDAAV